MRMTPYQEASIKESIMWALIVLAMIGAGLWAVIYCIEVVIVWVSK